MTKTISKIALLLGGVSVLALAHGAKASEFYTPMQPGVTTGTPMAALPPPGVYGNVDTYLLTGPVKDGKGNNLPVKLNGANVTGQLLYSTGMQFLGANYGVALTQPINFNTVKVDGGPTFTGYGLFNTIVTPEILSWNLGGGNFVGEGLSIYIPDGDFRHTGTTETDDSISNNFWTFEPNVAYSYLGNGWNVTLNNTFDFNTKDKTTDYQTGDIYYLDYTIAHDFGPVTVGLIGNVVQQFTPDYQFGQKVANTGGSGGFGNEYAHESVGPLFAYHIGHATVTFRYLYGFAGKNGGNPSFFHFGVAFPIL
jgi:hypothetical protein